MYVNRNNTIYNLYQNKFNIFITDCSEKIRTVAASEETAKILDIDINTPLLRIDRIGYTYHNEIVEIRTSYVHTSDIDYVRPQFSALGE
jgi:GntR family transcriptional regulator